jgi:hypothetical protein
MYAIKLVYVPRQKCLLPIKAHLTIVTSAPCRSSNVIVSVRQEGEKDLFILLLSCTWPSLHA